jgi:hypothetical protein
VQKSKLSGRDRKFRSVGGSGIPPPPTDHFSATSLKILFARIDRGSDRVGTGANDMEVISIGRLCPLFILLASSASQMTYS